MRYFLTFLVFISISFSSFSQAPQGFNYQAIVRDASGNVRSNEGVQFQFEIQDSFGFTVYSEAHTVVTNKYGLADGIIIGKGATADNFANIDWGNGTYYIDVTVDGINIGRSQLLSVPYALYALNAGSGTGGSDGVGIESTISNGDGTFTLNYTDGTSFTTIDLTGNKGEEGKSSYEVWLDAGNSGTMDDFLSTLVGEKGEKGLPGSDGKSAFQLWLDDGNTGNILDFLSDIQGPRGLKGDPGPRR